eukprot:COSAG01_NODE_2219_length_8143_cov_100.563083_5_plen_96_part_00
MLAATPEDLGTTRCEDFFFRGVVSEAPLLLMELRLTFRLTFFLPSGPITTTRSSPPLPLGMDLVLDFLFRRFSPPVLDRSIDLAAEPRDFLRAAD